jgi:hypothetical protein
VFSCLSEHLGRGHGSAFIELRKAFLHGSPQGLLRLEQSQALGEHIAFGEKSPLGDESLYERRQVCGDFYRHVLIPPSRVARLTFLTPTRHHLPISGRAVNLFSWGNETKYTVV